MILLYSAWRRTISLLVPTFAFCACTSPNLTFEHALPLEEVREEQLSQMPLTGALVDLESPEVQRAVSEFERTGKAPLIKKSGFVQYPYGESQPVVYCQPLRACDIELESGEEILGIALGDAVRWDATTIFSGDKRALTPHLIIKPKEFEIATNVIVSTTRRTYHIGLISSEENYVRRFRFYYPRELVQFKIDKEKIQQRKSEQTLAELPNVTAANLNFSYSIRGGEALPWRPVRVFDDGTRVYIQMSRLMDSFEAPALLLSRPGTEEGELVNYRVKKNYYIVDRLFGEAMLIAGVGREQDIVRVVKGD